MFTVVAGTGYTGHRVLARLPEEHALGLGRTPIDTDRPFIEVDFDTVESLDAAWDAGTGGSGTAVECGPDAGMAHGSAGTDATHEELLRRAAAAVRIPPPTRQRARPSSEATSRARPTAAPPPRRARAMAKKRIKYSRTVRRPRTQSRAFLASSASF